MLKSISSLIALAFLAALGGCASAPSGDRAGMYGATGAVIGAAVAGNSRIAPAIAAVGGLVGYEYGDRIDRLEAARGTTTCTTSNSGRFSQDGRATQTNGTYQCNGSQTMPGIQTMPRR